MLAALVDLGGRIGKYGSDMVRACTCLEVPKVTYVIGPDHGAANYGMCGRAFKPRFAFTNMRGRTTVMSGETAGFILEKDLDGPVITCPEA